MPLRLTSTLTLTLTLTLALALTLPKAFRERELYTQDTEAIFVKELPALRALFECYADGGGGGRADLMSLSEFDLLLAHTRIYDAEFTRLGLGFRVHEVRVRVS